MPGAAVFVNGEQISEPKVLHSGNRLILGKNHVFSFINPFEVRKVREAQIQAAKPRKIRPRKQSIPHMTTDESVVDEEPQAAAEELQAVEGDHISLLSNEEDDLLSIYEEDVVAVRKTMPRWTILFSWHKYSQPQCNQRSCLWTT